jgi:hypothetical protein
VAGTRMSDAMDFVRVRGHIHHFLAPTSVVARDPARVNIRTMERLTILIVSPSNL